MCVAGGYRQKEPCREAVCMFFGLEDNRCRAWARVVWVPLWSVFSELVLRPVTETVSDGIDSLFWHSPICRNLGFTLPAAGKPRGSLRGIEFPSPQSPFLPLGLLRPGSEATLKLFRIPPNRHECCTDSSPGLSGVRLRFPGRRLSFGYHPRKFGDFFSGGMSELPRLKSVQRPAI